MKAIGSVLSVSEKLEGNRIMRCQATCVFWFEVWSSYSMKIFCSSFTILSFTFPLSYLNPTVAKKINMIDLLTDNFCTKVSFFVQYAKTFNHRLIVKDLPKRNQMGNLNKAAGHVDVGTCLLLLLSKLWPKIKESYL